MRNTVVNIVIYLELLLFAVMGAVFFTPNPQRVWALLLLIPIVAMRWITTRCIWTRTPFDMLWVTLLGLCFLNVYIAGSDAEPPFTRGLLMLGRLIFGIALAAALVESVRRSGRLDGVLWVLVGIGVGVAVLAVGASSWSDKSAQFRFIVDALPRLPEIELIRGGMNVNEIGGVLAWTVPAMAGLALADPHRTRRWVAGAAFWVGMFAAFLGQSRLALGGIILALALIIWLLIPPGVKRRAAYAGLAAFVMLELLIVSGVFATGTTEISERDETSWQARLYIWEAALHIIGDHPWTGVGMNMYRDGRVRALYPVPGYERQVLPHTHNELLQLATDFGVPGALWWAALNAVVLSMAWRLWREGGAAARLVALACGAGLLAHAVYGLADAIPIWDRFAFVQYILIGALAGAYWMMTHPRTDDMLMKRLIDTNSERTLAQWRKTNAAFPFSNG